MFKSLREKLKGAISKFSKAVKESETEEEVTEEDIKEVEMTKEGKSFITKIKEKFLKKKEEIKEKKEKKEEKKVIEKKKEKKEKVKEKKKEENKVEEKKKEEVKEEEKKEPEKKKSFFAKVKERFTKKKEVKEEEKEKEEEKIEEEIKEEEKVKEEIKEEEIKEEVEELDEEEKKSIFKRITESITKKSLSEEKFEEIFWEMEVALLENNVAVEVVEKIKSDLKEKLVKSKIRFGKTEDVILSTLLDSIKELFDVDKIDLIKRIKQKKPLVMCFVGVNGSGKTTTIAKIAKLLQDKNLSCVIAAADTFRAAAIHQLEEHAEKLGVKLIKHDYGSDPAAVAYDAVQHARSKNKDVVLIDTAGRQHSNVNLVDEMKKIIRVVNPDLKIFVGDSLTGNDAVEQSRQFDEAIGIDAIILTKVDVDEQGGAAVSISYITKKPIMFIGVGQNYEDLKEFDKSVVLKSLGLEA